MKKLKLLIQMSEEILDPEELKAVKELEEYNEFGLVLECVIDFISEKRIRINGEFFSLLVELAVSVGYSKERYEFLEGLVD